ncbi:hypothetical protein C1H87_20460 [Flavivirga eckloniae]|uniref:Uncharacterized protein n=1 Tax=Flavivirga eckloniae TaxID=1803846 RepID=A0A2K9PV62_9FLAO|nr:hypothetical protein C1H87_20460 [Flavivirga eckloniae]
MCAYLKFRTINKINQGGFIFLFYINIWLVIEVFISICFKERGPSLSKDKNAIKKFFMIVGVKNYGVKVMITKKV